MVRQYRPTSTPVVINQELLQAEVAQLGNVGLSKDSQGWRCDIFDEVITNAEVQAKFDAHNGNTLTDAQISIELQSFTRTDAIVYFRQALIDANGNGAAIANLYTQAKAYEAQNSALTATMLSLKTITETADSITIDVQTNAGKAQYLRLFFMALALWS